MAETAAHLVEHVLPEQPIRQWVLSFPYPLRFLFATRPAVLTQVLGIVYRAISTFLLQAAAAYEEHDAWYDWIEERMARVASCLPGPPVRSVRVFLEHLDAMETILPIDSWFHRRARSIASAGAELRL